MKTKTCKSHWKCTTKRVSKNWGEEINNDFRFVAFDGKKHMDKIKKDYISNGVIFEYYDLVNLDEQ